MQWVILRHYAEMKLFLAVIDFFGASKNLSDCWHTLTQAGDLQGLGLITAATISVTGLLGLLKAIGAELHLQVLLTRLRAALKRWMGPRIRP